MKATLDRDIIVHLTPHGATEIGSLPKGVGLERLRWDGKRVVDLADREEIWVEPLGGGGFALHAVKVPRAQLVKMSYGARRSLVMESGVIRVLTAAEIQARDLVKSEGMLKARTREAMAAELGDLHDQVATLTKMLYLLILGVRQRDPAVLAVIDSWLADISGTFDTAQAGASITAMVGTYRERMQEYYAARSKLADALVSRAEG